MARPQTERATRKIFLRVPYKDKDEAKALGAGFEFYKRGERPEGAPPGYCYINRMRKRASPNRFRFDSLSR